MFVWDRLTSPLSIYKFQWLLCDSVLVIVPMGEFLTNSLHWVDYFEKLSHWLWQGYDWFLVKSCSDVLHYPFDIFSSSSFLLPIQGPHPNISPSWHQRLIAYLEINSPGSKRAQAVVYRVLYTMNLFAFANSLKIVPPLIVIEGSGETG